MQQQEALDPYEVGETNMPKEKDRPAHEVRLGRIKATIWANETEGGAVRHNVQLRRIYKDVIQV
jgi:hypothetical protein